MFLIKWPTTSCLNILQIQIMYVNTIRRDRATRREVISELVRRRGRFRDASRVSVSERVFDAKLIYLVSINQSG